MKLTIAKHIIKEQLSRLSEKDPPGHWKDRWKKIFRPGLDEHGPKSRITPAQVYQALGSPRTWREASQTYNRGWQSFCERNPNKGPNTTQACNDGINPQEFNEFANKMEGDGTPPTPSAFGMILYGIAWLLGWTDCEEYPEYCDGDSDSSSTP